MARVIHFEIPAENPERAAAFYKKAFGWNFQKWGQMDYWLVKTGEDGQPGINGGMMPKQGPVTNTANTIGVESVDASVKTVIDAGGKLVMEKTPIPTVGYFAYLQDTEGNIFGVMQADPNAK
jgi:predicted enzyme related to lactoylglutathione lyase